MDKPVAGADILLVPYRQVDRFDFYRLTRSDESGRFVFTGLPPADYKVVTMEKIEPNSYFDVNAFKPIQEVAPAIVVNPGEQRLLTVRIQP